MGNRPTDIQVQMDVGTSTANYSTTGSSLKAHRQGIDDALGELFQAGRFSHLIYLRDEQANGTDGGTFTSGAWRTRVLNTEVVDTGALCILASNQFTLAAGTYLLKARAPGFQCGSHRLQLYNFSDSSLVEIGPSASSSSTSGGDGIYAFLTCRFTIAASKTFELRHACQTTKATNGLGAADQGADPDSGIEVFAEVEIYVEGDGDAGLQSGTDYLHYQDQQTSGTYGGTFTSGAWRTRVLNTELADTGGHGSLASNAVTLAAGTYWLRASAPGYKCGVHNMRWRNTSDGITVLNGTSSLSNTTDFSVIRSSVSGIFTISASKTFELQHQCSHTRTTDGLGYATGSLFTVDHEVYAEVELYRLPDDGAAQAIPLPRGYKDHLSIGNNVTDSAHDIDIAPGVCRGALDGANMENGTTKVKRIDQVWASGTGSGGLGTAPLLEGSVTFGDGTGGGGSDEITAGSGTPFASTSVGDTIIVNGTSSNDGAYDVTAVTSSTVVEVSAGSFVSETAACSLHTVTIDTWYHVFAIKSSAFGTVDFGFDTDPAAATLLGSSGYSYYRRIGSILTDSSANVVPFQQHSHKFLWLNPPLDVSESIGTSVLRVVSSPPDVNCLVYMNGRNGTGTSAYVSSPDADDEPPSPIAGPLESFDSTDNSSGSVMVITDTSSRIRIRQSISDTIHLATLFYIDPLGEDND